MRLCDICPIEGKCERSSYNGWGECLNPGAQMDIWKPMSEEVPRGVPIIVDILLKDLKIYPILNVVTVFENDDAVHWPGMIPFKWKAEGYLAWCDFTKLEVTFQGMLQPAGDAAGTEASQVPAPDGGGTGALHVVGLDTAGTEASQVATLNGTGTEASLVADAPTGRHMCIMCQLYEFCVEEYGITSECLSCEDFVRVSD